MEFHCKWMPAFRNNFQIFVSCRFLLVNNLFWMRQRSVFEVLVNSQADPCLTPAWSDYRNKKCNYHQKLPVAGDLWTCQQCIVDLICRIRLGWDIQMSYIPDGIGTFFFIDNSNLYLIFFQSVQVRYLSFYNSRLLHFYTFYYVS